MKYTRKKDPLYRRYRSIISRLENPNATDFEHYGGRGIKMCEEWRNDYLSFKKWSEENGYSQDLYIDRIDNDGPYSPDNCRWVSLIGQNRNKRTNHIISYAGKALCMSEWAEITGIGFHTIKWRLKLGWSVEDALTIKPRGQRKAA